MTDQPALHPGSLHATPARPVVSVIIPARNEESNLGACLASIVDQQGVAFEIIVVDDNSTDTTAEIAKSYPAVRVIAAGPLPVGWSGKSHAIAKAIPDARGDWFLFTDADTIHSQDSIRKGISEALNCGADLLSYSPYQIVGSAWEKMLQPLVFAELSARFKYEEVNDPSSPVAAANGQYILARREWYMKVGGHEAFRSDLLEDVALARAVKRQGGELRFRYAPDVISTRMYRNLGGMWEGWTKNLSKLFPSPLLLAALRFVEFIAIAWGLALLFMGIGQHSTTAAFLGLTAALCSLAFTRRRFKKADFDWVTTLRAIPGLPVFCALLLNSFVKTRLLKRYAWRGRTYMADSMS